MHAAPPLRSFRQLACAAVGALVIVSTTLPSAARAQGTDVKLTMANITQMYKALQNVALASIGHPEVADGLSIDGDQSEEQAVASISSHPAVVAALRSAGLTPRQYVDITFAYLGASMAYGFSKSIKGYKIPASVNSANVAFVRDHEAELLALQKKMEADIRKAMPKEAESDTSSD